jgi:hypothetical protein
VTAALLLFLAAQAATATTILNTTIVSIDRPGHAITVRVDAGADSGVDRNRTRRLTVAPSAAAALATLAPGNAVLLTLRGETVVDIKKSAGAAGRPSAPVTPAPQQIPQLPPGARSPTNRGVPQLPPGADPPQARPVPQVAPSGGVLVITGSPSPGISPAGVAPTRPAVSPVAVQSPRPAVSPVAVASPKSPGTPKPVVLPSDPPPTPIPSPG